jgi:hypothetical protein
MARVYDAFDERLERQVAVKVLGPQTSAQPGMRRRFEQEARLAARLAHPHIVAVLDYGEDEWSCYIVMERLPGRSLRDELAAGPLPQDRALSVVSETLSGLGAAHRIGVLHRDVKPSNILLLDDGHVKLADFGIAKSIDEATLGTNWPADDMTMTGVVLGTPGYLAPERRTGQDATVQSDLYAVGAVLVEVLTGGPPSSDAVGSLPEPIRQVAATALENDPQDRYQSADAMRRALIASGRGVEETAVIIPLRAPGPTTTAFAYTSAAVEGGGTAVLEKLPPPPPPRPARTWGRDRRRALLVLIALLGAGCITVAALLAGNWSPNLSAVTAATQRAVHEAQAASHTSGAQTPADQTATALRLQARSLTNGGLPGDPALANALDTTAAQKAGAARAAAATEAQALAQVLLAGGGIDLEQYQAITPALQAAGATITPIDPVTTTTPGPPPGHGHGNGGGGDQG